MKFRRIDNKTVSCIITPEDMKAHGIKLDDIFEKKEEAMEFLHMVVGEAERRVNFRPQGAVTSMQMSVLPDHSISLTISEQSGAMFEEFLNKLQEKLGLNVPDEVRKELGALPEDERVARLREYAAKMLPGASGDAAKFPPPCSGRSRRRSSSQTGRRRRPADRRRSLTRPICTVLPASARCVTAAATLHRTISWQRPGSTRSFIMRTAVSIW